MTLCGNCWFPWLSYLMRRLQITHQCSSPHLYPPYTHTRTLPPAWVDVMKSAQLNLREPGWFNWLHPYFDSKLLASWFISPGGSIFIVRIQRRILSMLFPSCIAFISWKPLNSTSLNILWSDRKAVHLSVFALKSSPVRKPLLSFQSRIMPPEGPLSL